MYPLVGRFEFRLIEWISELLDCVT